MTAPLEYSAVPESLPDPASAHPGLAGYYAATVLHTLGLGSAPHNDDASGFAVDAARDWAHSGLLWLTGTADGPPVLARHALPSCARGALQALETLAPAGHSLPPDGAQLLTERSALLGYTRRGRVSANGSCHLLAAADGTLAINLARPEDWALLPAWLQTDAPPAGLDSLAQRVATQSLRTLEARGRLLGLPIAAYCAEPAAPSSWFGLQSSAENNSHGLGRAPRVVDLSSLWAGPLCAHLLQCCGAEVIKVESSQRPDGARYGNAEFFDLLNAGKASVAVDFHSGDGREQLLRLLSQADIVIESTRPRALQQLGVDAEALVAQRPALLWLGISGYGRSAPQDNWVAFGDDAGVAAGVAAQDAGGLPLFCGDAVCDPLTGIHAALAALALWQRGVGGLLDINLCAVARYSRAFYTPDAEATLIPASATGQWLLHLAELEFEVQPPTPRPRAAGAAALGADNARLLGTGDLPC